MVLGVDRACRVSGVGPAVVNRSLVLVVLMAARSEHELPTLASYPFFTRSTSSASSDGDDHDSSSQDTTPEQRDQRLSAKKRRSSTHNHNDSYRLFLEKDSKSAKSSPLSSRLVGILSTTPSSWKRPTATSPERRDALTAPAAPPSTKSVLYDFYA